MRKFAKLFESEKYGQIVVFRQLNDEFDEPEVRLFAKPAGLGVCSVAVGFEDSLTAADSADDFFNILELDTCEELVKTLFFSAALFTEGG